MEEIVTYLVPGERYGFDVVLTNYTYINIPREYLKEGIIYIETDYSSISLELIIIDGELAIL